MAYPAHPFRRSRRAQLLVELTSEPFAHLVSCAIGKRDRYDLVYFDVGGSKNLQVALHQHGCLTCSRAGGNRDVTIKRVRSQFLFWLQLAILFVNYNAHNANTLNCKLKIENCKLRIAPNKLSSICNFQFAIFIFHFSISSGCGVHRLASDGSDTSRIGTPLNSRSAGTNHQAPKAQPGIDRRASRQRIPKCAIPSRCVSVSIQPPTRWISPDSPLPCKRRTFRDTGPCSAGPALP